MNKYFATMILCCCLTMSLSAQKKYTISGYITDEKTSETAIGATIYDKSTLQGTITNVFGFYSLTLAEGAHSLSFSYVGYTPKTVEINLTKDTLMNIQLSDNIQLEEVVVTAQREDVGIQATGMGSLDIPVKLIEHTPSLLGETDVLRAIQFTPGVQQGVGGASALYVRGGGGDENLILLDGSPVYKVDHCFGFFSVFTPEAVKKVSFYKSSFPARYNGRVSSVIDVRTKDGDMNNYHSSFSIGLLTSRFNIDGPFVKDKTSFSLSARTTYLSLLMWPVMKIAQAGLDDDEKLNAGYWFYDFNAKVNHKFSDKDRLYVSFYRGVDKFWVRDKYKEEYNDNSYDEQTGEYKNGTRIDKYNDKIYLRWGNLISTVRWNHVFSPRLFTNTTISYNKYNMSIGSEYEDSSNGPRGSWSDFTSSEYNSSIIDYGAASDFDFMATDRHTIKFGFNYIYHEFKPETSITKIKSKSSTNPENNVDSSSVIPGGKTIYANELSVYAEDEWKITRQLSAIPGFAYTLFKVQDKAYNTIQPRFSLKYTATPFWTFKASYTRMSQCVHLLSSSPLALPTDLWVPITENIKPETADQYSVGAYTTKVKGWEFSVEGYYKELHNVLEYKDGMSFMGFSGNWQQMVAMGEGRSKGIEVLAKRTEGKATGWISYTLSKADRDFDNGSGVNNGRVFPFAYDRRHNISIVYSQKINDHIDFDANWTYFSGSHATISLSKEMLILPTGVDPYDYWEYESGQTERSEIKTDDIDFVENRNNYTLPASHLLCIGINFHKQKKHCERIFNISVYNAYNAKNPNFAFSKVKEKENPADPYNPTEYLVLRKLTILPIIPSFTFTYKF